MTTAEKIIQHISILPEYLQAEVLDFVEFIEEKNRCLNQTDERSEWSKLSLSYAMRGMENEQTSYSVKDIKEKYK
ncbi:MAG: DUF2281 domain-containing protein [PVC group bacterium]